MMLSTKAASDRSFYDRDAVFSNYAASTGGRGKCASGVTENFYWIFLSDFLHPYKVLVLEYP